MPPARIHYHRRPPAIADTLPTCDTLAPATNDLTPPDTSNTATPPSGDCHPAYDPCLPNLPGNAINCGDLPSSQKPVTVIVPGVGPYELNGDNIGASCESG